MPALVYKNPSQHILDDCAKPAIVGSDPGGLVMRSDILATGGFDCGVT